MKSRKFNSSSPHGQLSAGRTRLFKLIGILIPFLLLGLVELSLRVFHYGNDFRLFIEYPEDKQFLVFNPDASKKYFPDQQIATTGNIELFKKKKDSNTIRIFVLGESTTIGYPYFHNGSFHRWLQYRLMHTFPDKNFEIINLSLTAVNSYTVLGFAKELIRYEPDAVLIYTGHNEYYGALGVGSTQRMGGSPAVVNLTLSLRQLRLVQLMTNVYGKIRRLLGAGKTGMKGDRMKLMVADQEIPYGSGLYERGVEQFRSNMDKTLALFNKYHVPVFISNLVSNEKDLKPFISFPVDSIRFPGFKKNYSRGLQAFESNNLPEAWADFKKADQIDSTNALCNYYMGQVAYLQGNFVPAKAYFSKAGDLDGLRFRAPDEFNQIIAQLCRKYPDAHLADAKAAFEVYADHHIIGGKLILDHVHPNLRGYAILSDVFYEAMKKEHFFPAADGAEMSFGQLLQEMPVTAIDSLAGMYRILNLKRRWPYNEAGSMDTITTPSEEEKLAYALAFKNISWQGAMDELYDYYRHHNEWLKARTVLEGLVLEYPTDARFYEQAALLSGKLNDYEDALFYFKKSFYLVPSFDKARYLFVMYLRQDKPTAALPYLDYAIDHNTSGINLPRVKTYTEAVIQLQKKYRADSTNVAVMNRIAGAYLLMGNKDGASKYVEKALKADGKNKESLSLLAQIEDQPDHHEQP